MRKNKLAKGRKWYRNITKSLMINEEIIKKC